MEITFGNKIKINGEEVPEYLLKALYEWYNDTFIIQRGVIAGNNLMGGVTNAKLLTAGVLDAKKLGC